MRTLGIVVAMPRVTLGFMGPNVFGNVAALVRVSSHDKPLT